MTYYQAIDVSNVGQGLVLWDKVAAATLEYGPIVAAFAKATEGRTNLDRMLTPNRNGMRHFKYRLFYHWLSPNSGPIQQAQWFLGNVGTFQPGEGWMLDFEQAGTTSHDAYLWRQYVSTHSNRPYGMGYSGCVNTGQGFMGAQYWRDGIFFDDVNVGRILAAYTSERNAKSISAPHWCDVWQYTGRGSCPGVTGDVDLNRIDNPIALDRSCYPDLPPIPQPPKGQTIMEAHIVNSDSKGVALMLAFESGYTMTGLGADSIPTVDAYFKLGGAQLHLDDTAYLDLATKQGVVH